MDLKRVVRAVVIPVEGNFFKKSLHICKKSKNMVTETTSSSSIAKSKFTQSDTIIVAKPGDSWEVFQLDQEVILLEGVTMNIGEYLKKKGIAI